MSFFVFELIFAGLALGLLVIVFFIMRQLRRDREAKAGSAPVQAKPAVAKPRLPSLGRKPPEPEPEPGPPPVRKRQLRSLSEVERDAAEEVKVEADEAEAPPAEPVGAEPPKFNQRVLARLEAVFERLQAEEISLDAYVAQVLAEQAEVDQRIAALRAAGDSTELDEALAAQQSVRWCLDWATERRDQPQAPA